MLGSVKRDLRLKRCGTGKVEWVPGGDEGSSEVRLALLSPSASVVPTFQSLVSFRPLWWAGPNESCPAPLLWVRGWGLQMVPEVP